MNFNVRLRRLIAKYFGVIVECIYKIKFATLRFTSPPIIILTPGKVGSSSIYNTLKRDTTNPVFHIHNLSEEGIKKSVKNHLHSDRKSKPLHLIVSKLLKSRLTRYKGRLLVITVLREPISREVSSFFQNTEFYKDVLENRKLEINVKMAHEILDARFKSDICKQLESWFDLEIKSNFGIDIFSEDFCHEQKYAIYNKENISLLLIKMEDLNKVFPKAIQEFLNLSDPLVLKNKNLGDKKHYASSYKEVKDSIKLERHTLEQIINSRFFKRFYNDEKQKVLQKWSKNL